MHLLNSLTWSALIIVLVVYNTKTNAQISSTNQAGDGNYTCCLTPGEQQEHCCNSKTTICNGIYNNNNDTSTYNENIQEQCICRVPLVPLNNTHCQLSQDTIQQINRCTLPDEHPYKWNCGDRRKKCYTDNVGRKYECACRNPFNDPDPSTNATECILPDYCTLQEFSVHIKCDFFTSYCVSDEQPYWDYGIMPYSCACRFSGWTLHATTQTYCQPASHWQILLYVVGIIVLASPFPVVLSMITMLCRKEVGRWDHLKDLQDIDWWDIHMARAFLTQQRLTEQQKLKGNPKQQLIKSKKNKPTTTTTTTNIKSNAKPKTATEVIIEKTIKKSKKISKKQSRINKLNKQNKNNTNTITTTTNNNDKHFKNYVVKNIESTIGNKTPVVTIDIATSPATIEKNTTNKISKRQEEEEDEDIISLEESTKSSKIDESDTKLDGDLGKPIEPTYDDSKIQYEDDNDLRFTGGLSGRDFVTKRSIPLDNADGFVTLNDKDPSLDAIRRSWNENEANPQRAIKKLQEQKQAQKQPAKQQKQQDPRLKLNKKKKKSSTQSPSSPSNNPDNNKKDEIKEESDE